MAWYERSGPNAATVREWCKKNYHTFNVEESPKSRFFHMMIDRYLDRILEKRINGEEGDYGSYRGFATFGLSDELKELISKDMETAIEEIKCRFAVQEAVNDEVIEFGLMPPEPRVGGEDPKGCLTERGGGVYLEISRSFPKSDI